jgi:hypothetical protein
VGKRTRPVLDMENQTVEFRPGVAEIKQDLQRYREVIKKLSKTAEFTDEEVGNTTGNVSELLDVVSDVITLETQLPRKFEKLYFMLKQPLQ